MTIVLLGSDTPIGSELSKIKWVVWIRTQDFDPRFAKLFDPIDVLINCLSLENDNKDMWIIYDTNVVGNERMKNIAYYNDAHYIWISSPRVWNWWDIYYEDCFTHGDWTRYGNTMCLSELHIDTPKSTIIRGTPTKKMIEDIIKNWIFWKVNIPWMYWEWDKWWVLLSNYRLCEKH